MKKEYPFDPSIKHQLIIAIGMALWIFTFLYFTEPLDVSELYDNERLFILALYGLLGALCYVSILPIQYYLFKNNKERWLFVHEISFFLVFIIWSFLVMRSFYLYVVVRGEPNPYSLYYYLTSIFLPAVLTIFPIVLIGRFGFGKYKNKQIEEQKIEIKGDGNYEGIRLLLSDLIALEASDNYVEIHFQDSGTYKKQLIRARLSHLEKSLPTMMRTHRSYLINPMHFLSYKTDAGKLGLILSHEIFIPVSKTYTSITKETLNFTTN
ncbi:LytTR family transcriptional regulator DNA-binding domain-containing protein [Dokdonia sp. R86516]|uniref:LytTR family transcriptional regulator DNA-binding domain-containing protein n=1 Tax=Dokdonia sp. R86516 TaxID=3093856 RepID=UPI0037C53272